MDKIIFRLILILMSLGFIYATYRTYLREKYSGKKYIWSSKDIKNEKLKGFHWHCYTLFFVTFTINFIITNLYLEIKGKSLPINTALIFVIYLVYGLSCHFRQNQLEKKQIPIC